MRRVRIAELKDHLSQHLRAVEAGGEVEVMDRDRPIARILPADRPRSVPVRPPVKPFASIRDRMHPPADWRIASSDLLAEERQER